MGCKWTVYCHYEMLNKEAFRYWQLGSIQDGVNYSCVYVRSMAAAWQSSSLAFIASFRWCGDSRRSSDCFSDIFDEDIPHYVSFRAIFSCRSPPGTIRAWRTSLVTYTFPSDTSVLCSCRYFSSPMLCVTQVFLVEPVWIHKARIRL